jgi:hypothetical protein
MPAGADRPWTWRGALAAATTAALLPLLGGAAHAQEPDLEYQADLQESTERPGEDEEAYGLAAPLDRPWTLALWLPANANSNIAAVETDIQRGVALAPELTVDRLWGGGSVKLLTEAGLFVSASFPDPALDSSGWWSTVELQAGDASTGVAPYASWEPLTLHEAVFGRRLVTFHTLTAGIRVARGPTAINAFVRRREGGAGVGTRNTLAVHLNHVVALRRSAVLGIRIDSELRPYDADQDGRRTDIRARVRTRLTLPLASAVDLALTADLQRNWSNRAGQSSTNLVVGPALSARFGF